MERKKKNPLQYLFNAQFFMLWTLLVLGCDEWCGGNIVLGPTEATFFIFFRDFETMASAQDENFL